MRSEHKNGKCVFPNTYKYEIRYAWTELANQYSIVCKVLSGADKLATLPIDVQNSGTKNLRTFHTQILLAIIFESLIIR